MLGLIGKGDNLSLDRGTITRPYALDLPVVEGRIGQSPTQYFTSLRIGVDNVAIALFEIRAYLGEV